MSLFIFFRLFEEEKKADEKRSAKATPTASNAAREKPMKDNNRSQITSSMTLQLQQWPTAQYDSVLILSDDED